MCCAVLGMCGARVGMGCAGDVNSGERKGWGRGNENGDGKGGDGERRGTRERERGFSMQKIYIWYLRYLCVGFWIQSFFGAKKTIEKYFQGRFQGLSPPALW